MCLVLSRILQCEGEKRVGSFVDIEINVLVINWTDQK